MNHCKCCDQNLEPVLPFKVYGDTREERDRVRAILENDRPDLDMPYVELTRSTHSSEGRVVFDPINLDFFANLIQRVCSRS